MIKTLKPTGGNFLHIEYVAEGNNDQLAFENIAVMQRGADAGLENGDFSDGNKHWTLRGGSKVVRDADKATVGDRALKFSRKGDQGNRMIERRDIGDILPGHEGERTFTLRMRPGYESLKLTFRMKRNDRDSKGNAEVIIDNFRMDLERVFRESDCIAESATSCLPSRLQAAGL